MAAEIIGRSPLPLTRPGLASKIEGSSCPAAGSGTRLNTIWKSMKQRCQNPRRESYKSYGGRGIKVCAEWQSFVGFLDWALTTDYSNEKELDRIDADGPYSPANCRWVSAWVNRNRRELDRAGAYLKGMTGKLSSEQIANAEARERGYRLNDGHGLYLQITPSGKKSWRYRFRVNGREKILTLGLYPKVTLWAAREAHLIARAQVLRGVDPAELKRRRRLKQK